ncbi:putative hydrolase [Oscillibacter valericigenes Sjm18-20]|nr:putative hydrolase [Oscillibacter valericigenes Sjm18-20]
MYYRKNLSKTEAVAGVRSGALWDESCYHGGGRLIFRDGHVVDPANSIDGERDIAVSGDAIAEVADAIIPERGDRIVDCRGLMVFPGLMDMHLHQGDLFELNIDPVREAACAGVTFAFTPGAGNTFMAPALLGAEIDRGLPVNLGCYLGAASVFGTCLTDEELIRLFTGTLDDATTSQKLSRNSLTNTTAPLILGLKDHIGHFISKDDTIRRTFHVASEAGLLYLSHCQDPEHILRMRDLSGGQPFHLCHASAAGCGTHADPVEGMQILLSVVDNKAITAEFMASNIRHSGGNREAVFMPKAAQQMAWDAMAKKQVGILVSDGQRNATMKGGSATTDDLCAIFELAQMGVLSLSDAVATMTSNVAELFARRTGCSWWAERTGSLHTGALANLIVVEPAEHRAVMTVCNGEIVAFEGHSVPRGEGAGHWITKYGDLARTGVGDLTMFSVQR